MFEANWIEMMNRIGSLKKENAWIIVTNIYNPVANLNIPSTMDRGVENVIRNMNQNYRKICGKVRISGGGYIQLRGLRPCPAGRAPSGPDRSADHSRSDLWRIAGSADNRKPHVYCIFKYCTL